MTNSTPDTETNVAASVNSTPYGSLPNAAASPRRRPISLPRLQDMRERGEKIAMITAYDATYAAVADHAGMDCILVGDSLGMVCQGLHSTVGVTLETMRYHTESVTRGIRRVQGSVWVVADMPFGSYQESPEQALRCATVLMQAGAHMVKLEGGGWTTATVAFLVARGIPVCGHLGLTPQTVHALGGYRVQGRADSAAVLKQQAIDLAHAGATMMVLEMVPVGLSAEVTQAMPNCHTIGIGAGNGTAGQVLVMHDMLGINLGKNAKFVRNFMDGATGVRDAMVRYVAAVKDNSFPQNDVHAWAD
jgi:3-methyl-2-oxobutanoate hydroxymethyltransferase